MNVRIAQFLDGARGATGHAVIVDVFRAFTTAAFCVGAGAREIVLVADHEHALALKREDPDLFLTGEIGGKPIAGFDVGNSPSAIEHLDLRGRRVVQRTSAGTQGVAAAVDAPACQSLPQSARSAAPPFRSTAAKAASMSTGRARGCCRGVTVFTNAPLRPPVS